MNTYIAFLRGVNVGGKSMIKMAELKNVLAKVGFENVQTYIQSGNVIVHSNMDDSDEITSLIARTIHVHFKLTIEVVVFSKTEWQDVVKNAPPWWGKDNEWKHNLLIMIKPFDMVKTVEAIGELKPDIERIEAGDGVVYQSMSLKLFGKTTTGKLAANAIYKKMTIRNYNTTIKLRDLVS